MPDRKYERRREVVGKLLPLGILSTLLHFKHATCLIMHMWVRGRSEGMGTTSSSVRAWLVVLAALLVFRQQL